MNNHIWIHSYGNSEFAAQIIGWGYIAWAPYGGRHIMDDFGNMIVALPSWFYLPEE